MFTVEVEKKAKDEEFNVESLNMWHNDCYRGKFIKDKYQYISRITCSRCESKFLIEHSDMVKIIRTAVDGEKREIASTKERISGNVIQKT